MLLQNAPCRILHLISSMRWTGVSEPAASLAGFQQQAGHDVWTAAIWERSLEDGLRQRGIRLARDLNIPRRLNPFAIRRDILELRRFIVSHKIQIVHCHLLHDHWLAALAVRGMKNPRETIVVRTVHRYEDTRRDPWHRWLFEKATDLITTVSSEQKEMLARAYPGAYDRLRVIHGGVDPERFRPGLPGANSVRADMGEKPDARVAGIVAHLGYNRGHRWLLEAAPVVLERVPDATIWIVGQGELKKELRALVREPRFRGRVIMAGYRADDLPETYAAMNAALLLGLGSEGSARAALEAMASGLPVIAVDKGALKDTIASGVNGYLVPENDTDALAEALIATLQDPEQCRGMGLAAREAVLSQFTEQKRFEDTMEAYRSALATHRADEVT